MLGESFIAVLMQSLLPLLLMPQHKAEPCRRLGFAETRKRACARRWQLNRG
jgi:hypothetical protein